MRSEIVDFIADEAGVKVQTKTNPAFVRPNDNQEIIGSPEKIQKELGWKRKIAFTDTIRDMIAERKTKISIRNS